jgi:hypothetical protein
MVEIFKEELEEKEYREAFCFQCERLRKLEINKKCKECKNECPEISENFNRAIRRAKLILESLKRES